MKDFMYYTDKDGNNYKLVPQIYKVGDHACVGCAFKFGNSNACKEAKTCTPKSDWKSGNQPLIKGSNVWEKIN